MAKGDFKNQVKFGSGQPTNRGGRPKKLPFSNEIENILGGDGTLEFKPEMVKLLPNGNYSVKMPTQQMLAVKFMQMTMKGDPRFMEMYMKLFGEYKPEKKEVTVNEPLKGINFDNLSKKEIEFLRDIASK